MRMSRASDRWTQPSATRQFGRQRDGTHRRLSGVGKRSIRPIARTYKPFTSALCRWVHDWQRGGPAGFRHDFVIDPEC